MIEVGNVAEGVTPHCKFCGAPFQWHEAGEVFGTFLVRAGWTHSCPCSCKEGEPTDPRCDVHGQPVTVGD